MKNTDTSTSTQTPESGPKFGSLIPSGELWASIISSVRDHFSLFALLALVTIVIVALSVRYLSENNLLLIILAALTIILALIITVGLIIHKAVPHSPPLQSLLDSEKETLVSANKSTVKDANTPQLTDTDLNSELLLLKSVMNQAPRYSTPTYYLDRHLNVIDWNVAFELLFHRILGRIHGKHVLSFIAELSNPEEVADHARKFTKVCELGELPLVDTERLVYRTEKYGIAEFQKFAVQLTDSNADLQAWSVALMVTSIDWVPYHEDLKERMRENRLWSIYSVSYDKILTNFSGYISLIEEVTKPIASDNSEVLELGAGTGNVTKALLSKGCRVTAVENNPAMIERLFSKRLDPSGALLSIKNISADSLSVFKPDTFTAVVAVNMLYALEDPLKCIRDVARVLKVGGRFCLSTTTSESILDPLLETIKAEIVKKQLFTQLATHYQRIYLLNKDIELTIARRHSREQYIQWITSSGFRIDYRNDDAYNGAVTVLHATRI